jgi:hypothetical protein
VKRSYKAIRFDPKSLSFLKFLMIFKATNDKVLKKFKKMGKILFIQIFQNDILN